MWVLVQPLLVASDDFRRIRYFPDDKSIYHYRLTFYTGRLDEDMVAEKLVTKLSPDTEFGYPERFLEQLDEFLATARGRAFSFNISVRTSGSNQRKNISFGIAAALFDKYKKIRELGTQNPFRNLKMIYYDHTEESKLAVFLTRFRRREIDSVFDKRDDPKNVISIDAREIYNKAVEKLTELIPSETPVTLNGQYFEDCTFTGLFNIAILESLAGNHFINLIGNKLVIIGDWSSSDFAGCKISGSANETVSFNNCKFHSSEFTLAGDKESDLSMNECEYTNVVFNLQNYRTFSGQKGRYTGRVLSVLNVDKIDLSEGIFENCQIALEKVGEVNFGNAQFINCTLVQKGAPRTNILLNGASLTNSKLEIDAENVDLTNAKITGASSVTGKAATVEGTGAQLGSGIETGAITEWKLDAQSMSVSELKIGNLSVHLAGAFGTTLRNEEWSTVSVIGVPSIMPDARLVFEKLKLARNYVAEHPSLAADTNAIPAMEFNLG